VERLDKKGKGRGGGEKKGGTCVKGWLGVGGVVFLGGWGGGGGEKIGTYEGQGVRNSGEGEGREAGKKKNKG